MDSFARLLRALAEGEVRYAVIGVWGANQYAISGATIFTTEDRDLFLSGDSSRGIGTLLRADSDGPKEAS